MKAADLATNTDLVDYKCLAYNTIGSHRVCWFGGEKNRSSYCNQVKHVKLKKLLKYKKVVGIWSLWLTDSLKCLIKPKNTTRQEDTRNVNPSHWATGLFTSLSPTPHKQLNNLPNSPTHMYHDIFSTAFLTILVASHLESKTYNTLYEA